MYTESLKAPTRILAKVSMPSTTQFCRLLKITGKLDAKYSLFQEVGMVGVGCSAVKIKPQTES